MIYGTISGQNIKIADTVTAAETNNTLTAKFTFSKEWERLKKIAYFRKSGEESFPFILENDCIPARAGLNLSAGEWEISIRGYDLRSDTESTAPRLTTNISLLHVWDTVSPGENEFPEIPQTLAEQILAAAEDAKETAENVQRRADAGEFNGKDGATGAEGPPGKDGTSVTITDISESTESGGTSTVTFSDGKTLNVKNGKDGTGGTGGVSGSFGDVIYPDIADVIPAAYYPSHDSTFVDNNILAFGKPSGDGAVKLYDSNFTLLKSAVHNLQYTLKDGSTRELEMKSVDFNSANRALLVGNGAHTYSVDDSYLYIFYDAESWLDSTDTITFENCGDYTRIDVSELGFKSYAWWGAKDSDNAEIFVSVNYFKDIYLLKLGKASGRYDGTYSVLKHWKQTVNQTSNYGQHGGQFYNGSLYLVNNDPSKNEIYRCVLNDDGSLRFDVLDLSQYMANGELRYRYIDGLCIKDGYMYGAPLYVNGAYHNGENKVVLKIAVPGEGAASGVETVWVEYGVTPFTTVRKAVESGKRVLCYTSITTSAGDQFNATLANATITPGRGAITFSAARRNTLFTVTVTSSETWTKNSDTVQVTSNRVTSISGSSTDTQYPSAKAVWELFNSIPNAEGVGF